MAYLHLACKHTEKLDVTRLWGVGAWRQFQDETVSTASASPVKGPVKLPPKMPDKTKANPQQRTESHIEENIVVKARNHVPQHAPLQRGSTTTSAVKTNS
jgi:hypothetical protein